MRSALNEGRGPGEIQRMANRISLSQDDRLIIYDSSLRRVSIYKIDQDDVEVLNDINLELYPIDYHLTPGGDLALYVPAHRSDEDQKDRIVIANAEGKIVNNQLLEFESNEMMDIHDPSGQLLLSTSSAHHARNITTFYEDRLFINRSDELGFSIYSLETGELIKNVYLSRPDVRLSAESKLEFINWLITATGLNDDQKSGLISTMPDIMGKARMMHYDLLGNIWINIINDEGPDWLVFTETGDLIGNFSQEFKGDIVNIQNGLIFVSTEDEEGAITLKILEYEIH